MKKKYEVKCIMKTGETVRLTVESKTEIQVTTELNKMCKKGVAEVLSIKEKGKPKLSLFNEFAITYI
ncbi:hypothetical protein [Bacillus xiapuensis]|uniref:Uncharacterized protein n=1 Tax=Bacillus xiapuensis TaxID=2014075 RepID=A0ABU6N881_9BACI|nr:hypothetical protein [Bacillus xiapuensis]